ncbi:phenazine biosynthesis protein PhzF family [Cellulophaga algicola DSM 14237]|uniref:Phenazine biosynthesis protein PhzF family n=1 Tax=Cellulophaga algicola (strain DSM 14237 / IC166 / ACAM 630) TaxID=688270 RepID=E6XE00_CELAD|nr:PhzF family phenazine biosynthesis protein [Cellulophaga algicola]ADV48066.1 phenazine biosynthesis protein PhzF family [Cellulophaga algicola DSM 14237]
MDQSKTIKVQIINAFVANNKGGNPAGVVLNAGELSIRNKLEIAQKVGLSETAFVSSSKTDAFKLDFYTPTKQIAHCGHATVATFSYLKQQGLLKGNTSSKETIDGSRGIRIIGENAFMEQRAPKYASLENYKAAILKSVGLDTADLLPNTSIQLVNTGNSFVLIPVKTTKALKNLKPNLALIKKISIELEAVGYYAFTPTSSNVESDATTRMFAPSYGISEEAATGMAAGPLASYLYDVMSIDKRRFMIQQGNFMDSPSPSLIIVDLNIEKGKITQLMAGGKGVVKEELIITLDQ